jgi:hypothetical protein
MHRFGSFALVALLAAGAPDADWHVTYYDRNGDGVVDYELHVLGSGHADADWALIDTNFRGRYDRRVHWGVTIERQLIDIPVPKHMKITPGKSPKGYAY